MDSASPAATAAADPFDLSDMPAKPAKHAKPAETWEPRLPALGEPPTLADIRHPAFGHPVRCWTYRNAEARPLFAVLRFEAAGPDGTTRKETLPFTFGRRVWTSQAGKPCDRVGWHYKRPDAPLPLYGLDRLAARPDAPVLVCEGEKAADAAGLLFPERVAVASQGGAKASGKSDWTALAGRHVAIWPDADAPGVAYAAAVAELVTEAGAVEARIVPVPADFPPGWDLADPPPDGMEADRLAALLAEAAPPCPPPELPKGFMLNARGLFFLPEPSANAPDPAAVFVAAPFEIVGEANDGAGGAWGLVLRWRDRDGRPHEWSVPKRLVHGDGNAIAAELEDAGLECAPDQRGHQLLKRFVGGVRAARRLRCVDRTGWHELAGKRVFVLPGGEAFGPAAADVILQAEHVGGGAAFQVAGTLAEWRDQVARHAVGNDRLALFLAAAFAGPLLDILAEPSGGLHLVGRSQSGKSTVAFIAGSVWGRGDRDAQVRQWRGTANGLEGVAAETSDTVLILDEMGQADAREVGDVVYMLANQSGKARAGRGGEARRRKSWRTLFLSTGELTLAAKMADAGKRAMAGLDVRLVNLPADAGAGLGVFQELHGKPSAAALADHLRDAARCFHGTAARAFLRRLARDRAGEAYELRETLAGLRDGFLARHVPAGADGQVRSVASRFALIGAAGELARDYGMLPWPDGEAMRAAGACFAAWLATRGGTGAGEDAQAVAQVRAFIEAHGESRFTRLGREADADAAPDPSARTVNRAGFRRLASDGGEDRWEYLVLSETWRAEVCKGLDAGRAAQALADRGLLVRDGVHLARKVRVPGYGRPRCYVVDGDILGENDAE